MKLKSRIKLLVLLPIMIFGSNAFAIFCPTNFSQISMGDPIQDVFQVCGKPDYQNNYVKSVYRSEELIYYVKTTPFSASTSKLSVVIDNDQVINITITENAKVCEQPLTGDMTSTAQNVVCQLTQKTNSVGSTNACGPIFSVGDSAQTVQAACGQPSFVNHGQKADSQNTFTEFRYNGPPSISLIFENGFLVERVQN